MNRGQIISLDLIFALTLAIAIVLALNMQWGIMLKNFENYENAISSENAARLSLLYMCNGPGYPRNWNASNVQIIGLVSELDAIDETKVQELMKLDNAILGEKLGIPTYKVFINLTTSMGDTLNYTGISPINPQVSSRAFSFVYHNRSISKLYVTVWK